MTLAWCRGTAAQGAKREQRIHPLHRLQQICVQIRILLLLAQRLTAARHGYSFSKRVRSLNTSTWRKEPNHPIIVLWLKTRYGCEGAGTRSGLPSSYLHRAVFKQLLDVIGHTRGGHSLRVRTADVAIRQPGEGRRVSRRASNAASAHHLGVFAAHLPLSRASASSTSLRPSASCAAHSPRTHAL